MIVRTVVGDVQTSVAVNQCQVTITIETTDMSGTDGDEVTVITVVDGCCSVTKY